MVLSKSAMSEFLARPMRDSLGTKALSEKDLDLRIADTGAVFHTPLRHAQKVCFLLAYEHKKWQVLLGCGGGKTKLCYDLFMNTKTTRMMVLVPNVVNLEEWKKEGALHAPSLVVESVTVSGQKKLDLINSPDNDVVVITYMGLVRLCSTPSTLPGKKGKAVISKDAIKWLASLFDTIVLDESTELKNHQSKTFKIIKVLASKATYVYGLTGTPFEKNPIDMWSQMHVIDGGHSMGETIGLFRSAFCKEEQTPWATTYAFKPSASEEVSRRLRHASVRFSEAECQDLPEAQGGFAGDKLMLLPSHLSSKAWGYYKSFNTELQSIQHGKVEAVSSAYTRMRMVTAGWLGVTDEDGDRVELDFKDNPKLDSIISKAQELEDYKVIIVHWFNHSGQLACNRLENEKMKHTWVYGKTSTRKKTERLDEFRSSKGPNILVASTAISKGVNLQAAKAMLFFESPESTINRRQMEARILREGGVRGNRLFYDAVSIGTKDQAILEGLKMGIAYHDLIVDKKVIL